MSIAARYANLFQMSYISRDLDAAMAHAREHLGIAEFRVSDSRVDVLCEGQVQSLHVRAAIANIGRNQFEIIQPVSGPTHIYTDEVDLSGHILNFHHIAIAVRGEHENWLALLAEVRASGDRFAYLFPAEPGPDDRVCFCYVDTRVRLGHYTEYLWIHPSLMGTIGAMPDLDG